MEEGEEDGGETTRETLACKTSLIFLGLKLESVVPDRWMDRRMGGRTYGCYLVNHGMLLSCESVSGTEFQQ